MVPHSTGPPNRCAAKRQHGGGCVATQCTPTPTHHTSTTEPNTANCPTSCLFSMNILLPSQVSLLNKLQPFPFKSKQEDQKHCENAPNCLAAAPSGASIKHKVPLLTQLSAKVCVCVCLIAVRAARVSVGREGEQSREQLFRLLWLSQETPHNHTCSLPVFKATVLYRQEMFRRGGEGKRGRTGT